MTAVTQETLRILCRALGVEALPAGDVAVVEQWTDLPGYTVDRFRKIVLGTQQRGVKVSSVRYWEGAVADTFRTPVSRPRHVTLMSERLWEDYVLHYTEVYGPPDAQIALDLWFRYWSEREILRLPIEEKWFEVSDPLSRLPGREPAGDPLPLAA